MANFDAGTELENYQTRGENLMLRQILTAMTVGCVAGALGSAIGYHACDVAHVQPGHKLLLKVAQDADRDARSDYAELVNACFDQARKDSNSADSMYGCIAGAGPENEQGAAEAVPPSTQRVREAAQE